MPRFGARKARNPALLGEIRRDGTSAGTNRYSSGRNRKASRVSAILVAGNGGTSWSAREPQEEAQEAPREASPGAEEDRHVRVGRQSEGRFAVGPLPREVPVRHGDLALRWRQGRPDRRARMEAGQARAEALSRAWHGPLA